MRLKGTVSLPSLIGKWPGRCKIYKWPTQRLNWRWITRTLLSQGIITNGNLQGPALFGPCCPRWPYFMSPSLHSPHWSPFTELTLFAQAVPLPSMARLHLRLHSDVSPSEGLTLLLNLLRTPCLLLSFFKAHCFSFRVPPGNCNFPYTCVGT